MKCKSMGGVNLGLLPAFLFLLVAGCGPTDEKVAGTSLTQAQVTAVTGEILNIVSQIAGLPMIAPLGVPTTTNSTRVRPESTGLKTLDATSITYSGNCTDGGTATLVGQQSDTPGTTDGSLSGSATFNATFSKCSQGGFVVSSTAFSYTVSFDQKTVTQGSVETTDLDYKITMIGDMEVTGPGIAETLIMNLSEEVKSHLDVDLQTQTVKGSVITTVNGTINGHNQNYTSEYYFL